MRLQELARAGRPLSEAGVQVVDAHAHFGPVRNFFIPDADASGLIRVADRCGVSRIGVSSHLAVGPDWIQGNRLTADAVAQFPDRLFGYAVASPHDPARITHELADVLAMPGMRGIKLHPDLHAYKVTDPGYAPAWEYAVDHGVPVICHTFHNSPYCDPQMFVEVARRYPSLQLVLIHSGAQRAGFPVAIRVVDEHPNLFLDTSGSFITGTWITRMVRSLGATRVIFSSDIPFIDMRFCLGRVVFSALTDEEKALILSGNAQRLLRL
jgi:predicted TIM-barrel fold metal-dependent hydrolase